MGETFLAILANHDWALGRIVPAVINVFNALEISDIPKVAPNKYHVSASPQNYFHII